MSSKSAAFHKAKETIVNDPKYQQRKNELMASNNAKLKRANVKEEKRIQEEQKKKSSGFLSRIMKSFSRKSSKGGKKNRQTKRKNKKC